MSAIEESRDKGVGGTEGEEEDEEDEDDEDDEDDDDDGILVQYNMTHQY